MRIKPVPPQQIVVITLLDDAAVIQHDQLVRGPQRTQPV